MYGLVFEICRMRYCDTCYGIDADYGLLLFKKQYSQFLEWRDKQTTSDGGPDPSVLQDLQGCSFLPNVRDGRRPRLE